MNFFYGLKLPRFECNLTIPKFENRNIKSSNYSLYEAYIKKNKWLIKRVITNNDKDFFFIQKNHINNHKIYFLATSQQVNKNKKGLFFKKLYDFNNFTDTDPPYRANLMVYNKNGGFSSFQSEYPYRMTESKGSSLSSIYTLTNSSAKNYLCVRNIYYEPKVVKFPIYFININTKKILKKVYAKTNYTSTFSLDGKYLKPEVCLISKNYTFLPMYISVKNQHVSFEHTHPPHEYILSDDKFFTVNQLKKSLSEIIN